MITWIVVVGSTLVMLIWISIYSAFNSVDFNDEVVVLFGEITFWATVIVTMAVTLGNCLVGLCSMIANIVS